jgi:ADP-heptose:LPS heptosyltransferase
MGGGVEEAIAKSGMVQDLRGQLTLPEVVGALAMTNLVFTLDNGILHLACATDTPTVGLFRYGIHRLWAPPVSNLKVIVPMPGKVVGDIPAENAMRALGISWR